MRPLDFVLHDIAAELTVNILAPAAMLEMTRRISAARYHDDGIADCK